MADLILYEQRGGIGLITFNRPEAHNALNAAMVEEFQSLLEHLEKDETIRVLILTGSGEKSFISGSDVRELKERTPLSGVKQSQFRQRLLTRMEQLPIPSIAAINGYAFGAGLEIAMSATLRVASEKAKMGQLEVNLGIIPGAGGIHRLARLIGMGRAAELILTGKVIDATEAYRMGLVNQVVSHDSLLPECEKMAQTIMEKGPVAIQYALKALYMGYNISSDAAQLIESLSLGICFSTQDSKEGLSAFLEKRKPQFGSK